MRRINFADQSSYHVPALTQPRRYSSIMHVLRTWCTHDTAAAACAALIILCVVAS